MSKETIKYPGYEAYREKVNIGLFNDIIAFMVATTAADTNYVQRELGNRRYHECDNIVE
jgi:hypothetical protein